MVYVLIIEALIVAIIVGIVRDYWWMGIVSFISMMILAFVYPVLYSIALGLASSLILWALLDFSETIGTFIMLVLAFGSSLLLHLALINVLKENLD